MTSYTNFQEKNNAGSNKKKQHQHWQSYHFVTAFIPDYKNHPNQLIVVPLSTKTSLNFQLIYTRRMRDFNHTTKIALNSPGNGMRQR